MALELHLRKEGENAPKLRLSLNKGSRFTIELYWDSPHDLDAHALLATNTGSGAKVGSFAQVLSTYNSKKTNPAGALPTNTDGSFATPCGTLHHSGDSRSGVGRDIDEVIAIDGSKAPRSANEIPIFITFHGAERSGATFASVVKAGIRIKDEGGTVLGEYELSKEFGRFTAVQMGNLVFGDGGWEYVAAGTGFNGDFNTILEHFS